MKLNERHVFRSVGEKQKEGKMREGGVWGRDGTKAKE